MRTCAFFASRALEGKRNVESAYESVEKCIARGTMRNYNERREKKKKKKREEKRKKEHGEDSISIAIKPPRFRLREPSFVSSFSPKESRSRSNARSISLHFTLDRARSRDRADGRFRRSRKQLETYRTATPRSGNAQAVRETDRKPEQTASLPTRFAARRVEASRGSR